MHNHDLVSKLFYEHDEQLKFLEQYYSDKIGYDIRIELTNHSTSFFRKPVIYISTYNLMMHLDYDINLTRPLFYSLLLHEIGHAIYTDNLPFTETTNVLEDNRIEHHISTWNKRVNFRLMRYIYQDKQLAQMELEQILDNKQALSLALLRTVDSSLYREMCSYTLERKDIVDQIVTLDNLYTNIDYELRLCEHDQTNELVNISNKVDELINKLIDIREQEQEQEQQQQQQQQEQASSDPDQEQEQEQEPTPKPQDIRGMDSGNQEEYQKLEQQVAELMQKTVRDKLDTNYNTPILKARHQDTTPYDKVYISAFDTKRQSGIKGKGFSQSSVGNAKQLNMQRYMRRNFVSNEKLFDKQSYVGRGGKNAKAVFYLDISGSMDGYRLRVATNYLKSFYDTMHKYMDIRIFGFGSRTYELNRNALNYDFISNHLKGSTRLHPTKHSPDEQIIVITDGAFDNEITQELKNRARFIVIDFPEEYRGEYFGDVKHVDYISSRNLQKTLERATEGIKKMLKGA